MGLCLAALRSGRMQDALRIAMDAGKLHRTVAQVAPPGGNRHCLIIDRALPDPTLDSGSVRLVGIIRLMQRMGWSVTFMADTKPPARLGPTKIGDIEIPVEAIGALPRWLRSLGNAESVVWLSRFQTALKHAPLARALAPHAHVVFDTVDLHFLREQRRLASERNPRAEAIAASIRDMEIRASSLADTTVVVSDAEGETLASIAPGARIVVLGNIHDPVGPDEVAGFDQRAGLLFIGGMQHAPNLDALEWLSTELLAAIRARVPGIELHVVGAITEDQRKRFQSDAIAFHGRVPALGPWLAKCRISIAPLRIGAGVKGKINDAMSHGLPVVATSIAAEGMHLADRIDVLIADDAEAFASAVHALYHDPTLWARLSMGGLRNIERHYATGIAEEALRGIVRERTIPA